MKGDQAQAKWFCTTHWSVVLEAGKETSENQLQALSELCRVYWWPLYAFVRQYGHNPHDSQDLTQEFFGRLLENGRLKDLDRRRGKFRSFLLTSLKHFLINQHDKAQAQKRGGKVDLIPLDQAELESRYENLHTKEATPDKVFEQTWVMTLLNCVFAKLEEEQKSNNKHNIFQAVRGFLTSEDSSVSYRDLARRFETTEAAIKMTVHRLRRRYGEILREEISRTVPTPAEVDDEIKALFSAFS